MNELKEQIIDAIDGLCPDKSAQGSKDYIEFLIDQYTAKKELEARIDEIRLIAKTGKDVGGYKEISVLQEYLLNRITKLSYQLTNNKEGIEK